jgi:hypothetical protein
MVYSITKIPKYQQALFGQQAVHALVPFPGGNRAGKLAFHAKSHGADPAPFAVRGSAPGPARPGKKAVVIAPAPSKPPSFTVKSKAGNQHEGRRGKGRLESERRREGGFPHTEGTLPPGAGGGGQAAKEEILPFNAGNEDLLLCPKGRFKERPGVYFIFHGKEKEEGVKTEPHGGITEQLRGFAARRTELFGRNGRKAAFHAPSQAVFVHRTVQGPG